VLRNNSILMATVTCRLLYLFVVMEHASRCLLHGNMMVHPTVQWTPQQLREAIRSDHRYHSPSVLCLLLLQLHLQLLDERRHAALEWGVGLACLLEVPLHVQRHVWIGRGNAVAFRNTPCMSYNSLKPPASKFTVRPQ